MGGSTREERLRRVYEAGSPQELGQGYDAWAEAYEADVQAFGYTSPAVCLALAARHLPADAGPILDAGAGTGMMGELLALIGYRDLEALDLSEGMLAIARRKGVYAALHQAALGGPLDLPDDRFAGCTAVGVFTTGHAGPESFDELLRVVRPGGIIAFTVTRPVYEGGFRARQDELERAGRWTRVDVTGEFAPLPKEESAPMGLAFAYRVG